MKMDKPKENEVYMLIGGADDKCISNGNSWEESKIASGGSNLDYDEYLFDHKEQLFKEFLEQEDEEMTFEDYCVKRHQEKAFLCKARHCHFELDDMYNTDDKYCNYCSKYEEK